MPGPFPGMDPYLESPRYWTGFHGFLIAEIAQSLNEGLPAGLAANAEERVYVAPWDRQIVPDVHVTATDRVVSASQQRIAVLDRAMDHGVVIAYPEEEHESYIAIRSVDDWDEIVTIIEVLSPSNKREGGPGRDAYVTKQRDILDSSTNLVEIDLLRGGVHTAAPPRAQLERYGRWDCLVTAHRASKRWHFEYWLNRLPQPLPVVKTPLTRDLPDFDLDLQSAFGRAYDKGPYRRRVDYRIDPPGVLEQETLAWIDTWLRERGLRPT